MTVSAPGPIAGVVLAAGLGTRLRPLTGLWPKALCAVGGVALVDLAIERVRTVTTSVAVNAHHLAEQLEAHVREQHGESVHMSVERVEPLGTAGALGALRDWIAGRPVLATNADAWLRPNDVGTLVEGWDGASVRILATEEPERADFDGRWRFAGASLLPARVAAELEPRPSSLYDLVWRPAHEAGRLAIVAHPGEFLDCGTPADYLEANRRAFS